MFDSAIENLNSKQITDWFLQDKSDWMLLERGIPISSPEDLGVGYVTGYLASAAHTKIRREKENKKIKGNIEKITGKKLTEDKETKKQRSHRLTKSELKEVRKMLKLRIPKIREEVNKGLNI